jgi:hypothetical protein
VYSAEIKPMLSTIAPVIQAAITYPFTPTITLFPKRQNNKIISGKKLQAVIFFYSWLMRLSKPGESKTLPAELKKYARY